MNGKINDRAETIEAAFNQCQHLIHSTIRSFVNQHGGDIDEAMSDAYYHFINTFKNHKQDKGSFGARVCYRTWAAMYDKMRREITYRNKNHQENDFLRTGVAAKEERVFDEEEFKSKLSMDGCLVYDKLFELRTKETIGVLKKPLKESLVEALSGIGWTIARIAESFNEIGAALLS